MGLVALMAAPSLAGLAIDFTSTAYDFTNGSWSMGFEITTNAPIYVNKLGVYDDQKNGLTESHDVGIYNAAGTLLASATVSPSDPLTSWFRMVDITPLLLAASQTYYIQAVSGNENYTYWTTGFTVDPNITFVYDAYYYPPGNVLNFPNSTDLTDAASGGAYFGPNYDSSPVPVPPSLLLLASGLLGLGGWRKFRKN